MTSKEEAYNIMYWYWTEYHDLERPIYSDRVKNEFPQVWKAWENYKEAKRLVQLEIDAIEI